ncbi:MerC mercury resistance protein [Cyclobacterium lianum]|uniref:MerC mercury resistance protein n=1 Tax=Cyclobacterium lianum TaxID=388280 RepID=A0A1M7JSU3_9BACT|nr:MerC domain-containing protein [Cyclobacterium lianum]SHM55981.1 MerC mercury resistance protein [Cyclobacterium lianum]
MKTFFIDSRLDFVGFSASLVCAIHCMALPFLISVLPFLGLGFLANPRIEYTIIVFSFLLAVLAVSHGFKKHHQRLLPLILIASGFIIILVGLIWGHGHAGILIEAAGPAALNQVKNDHSPVEHLITPLGAVLVSFGHYVNWLYFKKSKSGCLMPDIKSS